MRYKIKIKDNMHASDACQWFRKSMLNHSVIFFTEMTLMEDPLIKYLLAINSQVKTI